jgi:hypothetical protein
VEAERRLLFTRDEILDRAWQLGKMLAALKEEVGRGNWYVWLAANLPELGSTEIAGQKTAARCIRLHRDNPDRRNSGDPFSFQTVRDYMWGYVPAKERLRLEGDEPNKAGAHHLTFCNEFRRWDSQVRRGAAKLYLEHFSRRIKDILGPDDFTKLTS